MTAKLKIRLDSIEQAHRALEALPQHQPDEVTKSQAIQRLLPQIRASQSKGYSLAAIGKVLTERGIPVTTGALRAHVSGATAKPEGKKKRRRAKQTAEGAPRAQVAAPKAAIATAPATETKAAAPLPRKTNAGASAELDWDPAGRSEKFAPSPSRSSFVPRPDTDLKDL
jgi:hypothetical protein